MNQYLYIDSYRSCPSYSQQFLSIDKVRMCCSNWTDFPHRCSKHTHRFAEKFTFLLNNGRDKRQTPINAIGTITRFSAKFFAFFRIFRPFDRWSRFFPIMYSFRASFVVNTPSINKAVEQILTLALDCVGVSICVCSFHMNRSHPRQFVFRKKINEKLVNYINLYE